ncbi:MAG: hypothetical protein A2687_04810 [Candidatus Levybacteria bacterium RIFCSPHIGHO2_01_FULL_38_26]|nr:MAG: hypothetical protein A2687_04810 [Candidatus Levybacteria bacterium RIFCSPHIGHO2_01_FULL_38_26]
MSTLKKPTILNISIGMIIYIFKSQVWKWKIDVPEKIGKYKLAREVKKENPYMYYGIGVYKYNKKDFFIKTWTGRLKDYRYYDLVNEYILNKLLHRMLVDRKIYIPEIIACKKTNSSLSIVYEFVKGKSLTNYPVGNQAEIISKILNAYIDISSSLTKKEATKFPKRDMFYYIFFFPFIVILTIASNIKSARIILKSYTDFLISIKKVSFKKLHIAHRDMCLDNIIVKGSKIYLLDYGRTVLTLPGYDITFINIRLKKSLSKLITNEFKNMSDKFLTNYILIHLSMSFGRPKGHRNIYLQTLYEKYT